MNTKQPEALRLADELVETFFDSTRHEAAAELRRQHNRITEIESQLAQRFDAADVATASAQGFRDGVASVSAGSEPVAWREHVEQRLLAWRQSFVNRSGDQLALDDFMDEQSLDDLIDFVCDEWALKTRPSPQEGMAGWKPIETAPANGQCLVWCDTDDGGEVMKLRRDKKGNWLYEGEPTYATGFYIEPTHWMPLPAAPGPADGESNELC